MANKNSTEDMVKNGDLMQNAKGYAYDREANEKTGTIYQHGGTSNLKQEPEERAGAVQGNTSIAKSIPSTKLEGYTQGVPELNKEGQASGMQGKHGQAGQGTYDKMGSVMDAKLLGGSGNSVGAATGTSETKLAPSQNFNTNPYSYDTLTGKANTWGSGRDSNSYKSNGMMG